MPASLALLAAQASGPAALQDRGLVDPAASGFAGWIWLWVAATVLVLTALVVLVGRVRRAPRRVAR